MTSTLCESKIAFISLKTVSEVHKFVADIIWLLFGGTVARENVVLSEHPIVFSFEYDLVLSSIKRILTQD